MEWLSLVDDVIFVAMGYAGSATVTGTKVRLGTPNAVALFGTCDVPDITASLAQLLETSAIWETTF